jgi:hypothetical protein
MNNNHPRYQVFVDSNEALCEVTKTDGGFICEFVDGSEKTYTGNTDCDVVIMNVFEINSLEDVIELFKPKNKFYTTTGNTERDAFLQEFSEDQVDPGDYDLDDLSVTLRHSLFGKLSKTKTMTLQKVFNDYHSE